MLLLFVGECRRSPEKQRSLSYLLEEATRMLGRCKLALILAAMGLLQAVGCSSAGPKPASSPEKLPAGVLTTKKPGEFKKAGENPFTAAKWFVDPYAQAVTRTNMLKKQGSPDAALIEKMAKYGGADWIGDWTKDSENYMRRRVNQIEKDGALPIFILYNVPGRDCGQYSAGGLKTDEEYRKWIEGLARGIGDRKAVVVLEPDALGLLDKCLTPDQQKARLALIHYAVTTFNTLPFTYVYLDSGHSDWMPPEVAAERLKGAGVADAQGFALNVSNYKATDKLIEYGKKVSALVGGKHFILDTSRNGNGPPSVTDPSSEESWCNPKGRALGSPPTTQTADPLVDAYLWLKKPGESDGQCNGGPKAGEWFQEQALELAKNAKW